MTAAYIHDDGFWDMCQRFRLPIPPSSIAKRRHVPRPAFTSPTEPYGATPDEASSSSATTAESVRSLSGLVLEMGEEKYSPAFVKASSGSQSETVAGGTKTNSSTDKKRVMLQRSLGEQFRSAEFLSLLLTHYDLRHKRRQRRRRRQEQQRQQGVLGVRNVSSSTSPESTQWGKGKTAEPFADVDEREQGNRKNPTVTQLVIVPAASPCPFQHGDPADPLHPTPAAASASEATAAGGDGGGGTKKRSRYRCTSSTSGDDLSSIPGLTPRGRHVYRYQHSSVRMLQTTLMYLISMDSLRYTVTAMSLGWSGSLVVDRSGLPHVFGEGLPKARSPNGSVRFKGCACGDNFVALLSRDDELWVYGDIGVTPREDGKEKPTLKSAGSNVRQISGGECRLVALGKDDAVRPVNSTGSSMRVSRETFPYRKSKWLCLTYRETLLMVGTDNILYKHTIPRRNPSTPRRVMSLLRTGISRVHAGTGFTLAIDLNGRLLTFGKNKRGQLGIGLKQELHRAPFLHVELAHHFVIATVGGDSHSLILTASGVVYGAGSNAHGQLGLGIDKHESLYFTIVPLPCRCVGIAAGPLSSMFAGVDGNVYSCGSNDCGQTGHPGPSTDEHARCIYVPTQIEPLNGVGVAAYVTTRPYDTPFGSWSMPGCDQSSARGGKTQGRSRSQDGSSKDGKVKKTCDDGCCAIM